MPATEPTWAFLQATVDLAEQHAEVGDEFTAWLAQRAGVVG